MQAPVVARRSVHLGLRAQLILALGLVFVLSFSLLAVAIVQLTRHSAARERGRHGQRVATMLAGQLDGAPDANSLRQQLAQTRMDLSLQAIMWRSAAGTTISVGEPEGPAAAHVRPDPGGGELSVWVGDTPGDAGTPLQRLLVFYVALTVVVALSLSFVLLTMMIVRPLEAVTACSERLAAGDLSPRVPAAGAAEVVQLATSFNRMAAQLRQERKALEDRLAELEQATVELRDTQQQLVHGERLASVGRLAAGVAHEIGNPLAAILGLIEILEKGGLPRDDRDEFLARVHTETERINGIIRSLLDFARRDPDHTEEYSSVDIVEVARDAAKLVLHRPDCARVRIKERFDAALPKVHGSRSQLTQVLLNLLLNAVDAVSGQGTVTLIATADDAGWVTFSVLDDGPGIEEAVIEHLFEPFVTTKAVGQGTGLGLAVAHSLVERMGGALVVDTRHESGARFDLRLRIAAA